VPVSRRLPTASRTPPATSSGSSSAKVPAACSIARVPEEPIRNEPPPDTVADPVSTSAPPITSIVPSLVTVEPSSVNWIVPVFRSTASGSTRSHVLVPVRPQFLPPVTLLVLARAATYFTSPGTVPVIVSVPPVR